MTNLFISNCRELNADNYKELPEIHLKQMDRAASLAWGDEFTTAEDFVRQCGDGYMEAAVFQIWDVAAIEQPDVVLYHCFRYYDDMATVFIANTIECADVGANNFTFEPHFNTPDKIQLAADMQKAFFEH